MNLAASSGAYPSLTPEELIAHLAVLGYKGVEWRVADVNDLRSDLPWDYRKNNRCTLPLTTRAMAEIRETCSQAGISIVGLSPYLPVGDISLGQKLIELACEAGTQRIRVWAPASSGASYQASFARFARFLDELIPLATQSSVHLALEIHQHTICSSASLASRVLEAFPDSALKVIYDMGNLAVEGLENNLLALELLGSSLAHVQVKNARYSQGAPGQGWTWAWCPIEQGILPLSPMISELALTAFSDWISVEDFCTDFTDTEKLMRNKNILEDYWNHP